MSDQQPRNPVQMMLTMNVVICVLLFAFAILPLLAGWDPVITGLMLLPAIIWLAITWRMYREYKRRSKK
jgi:Flp pilus assembly protein protease CpaA